jgi:hypothetical protein
LVGELMAPFSPSRDGKVTLRAPWEGAAVSARPGPAGRRFANINIQVRQYFFRKRNNCQA